MSLTEDQLTAWIGRQRLHDPGNVPIGIGDDMAQVALSGDGATVLLTTDMLLEGVHFDLATTDLHRVGYKAMAVNLSDCAAMACRPRAGVVSLALPPDATERDVQQLYTGLWEAADRFDCPIVGGDLTRWAGPTGWTINVALVGQPMADHPVRRSGARPGDHLLVTGRLGGSLGGHHLTFVPRLQEASRLVSLVEVHAMMDLSDGLARDLPRLCRASGVGARIERAALPLSEAARRSPDPLRSALQDGEDFELLLAIAPENVATLLERWDLPTALTDIGVCTSAREVCLVEPSGRQTALSDGGYDHLCRPGDLPS